HHRMTVFMTTHDIREGFELGTRLLVFDKVRLDPQAPDAYGASITYDLPLNAGRRETMVRELDEQVQRTERFLGEHPSAEPAAP
ncbi:MAG: ABC transporter ATP-binding protein, partial [Gammaproteobacteria bacterium]|nr:ABC transporter ATP-binding protein [Gammaproteobacteria bacterium]